MINEEMVQIYDNNFTHNEILYPISFYESPTGKKILEKTPEITKDLMNVMMSKYLPGFQGKIKSKIEELKQ